MLLILVYLRRVSIIAVSIEISLLLFLYYTLVVVIVAVLLIEFELSSLAQQLKLSSLQHVDVFVEDSDLPVVQFQILNVKLDWIPFLPALLVLRMRIQLVVKQVSSEHFQDPEVSELLLIDAQ